MLTNKFARADLEQRIITKVLCIHAQRFNREDELVVRIGNHTIVNVSLLS
jgi:hypothetical protein